jgi:hypothetical protein
MTPARQLAIAPTIQQLIEPLSDARVICPAHPTLTCTGAPAAPGAGAPAAAPTPPAAGPLTAALESRSDARHVMGRLQSALRPWSRRMNCRKPDAIAHPRHGRAAISDGIAGLGQRLLLDAGGAGCVAGRAAAEACIPRAAAACHPTGVVTRPLPDHVALTVSGYLSEGPRPPAAIPPNAVQTVSWRRAASHQSPTSHWRPQTLRPIARSAESATQSRPHAAAALCSLQTVRGVWS